MKRNKKALIGFAVFGCLCWTCVGVVAYLNVPNKEALPRDLQKVVPLDKPTNIELDEDDAGVGK